MAEKKSAPKKGNEGKTVTVRQIRSANRKPDIQAQTLRGPVWARSAAPARWKIRRRCVA